MDSGKLQIRTARQLTKSRPEFPSLFPLPDKGRTGADRTPCGTVCPTAASLHRRRAGAFPPPAGARGEGSAPAENKQTGNSRLAGAPGLFLWEKGKKGKKGRRCLSAGC